MKRHFFLLIICFPVCLFAQNKNIFLDRSFWKTMPNIETVDSKIEQGNDPVRMNANAFDATVYAILENAPLETIKYLLSLKGNEVDKITHDGRNYLLWAAYKGNKELIQFLIEAGSKVDHIDDHGYGIITFTAAGGQESPEVYDLLLANGANIKETNREGANALLLIAPHSADETIMQYFLDKGLDLHGKDNNGTGIFHYAARKGNMPLMKRLIDKGVDYQSIDNKGRNAMMFASYGWRGQTNSVDIFKYLYDLGLEADIVDGDGETPLHNIVSRAKDKEAIYFFIQKGVNVNQIDKDGNTALLNAIRGNNLAVAKQLVPMVRNINHTNKDGYTALTYAITRNSIEAFDFLLEKGATVNWVDAKGNNLVYHAFTSYHPGKKEAFQHFIQKAKAQNLVFKGGFEKDNTLAHLAVDKGKKDLLMKAMEEGVDINQKNQDGLTPLHLAAMKAKDNKLLNLLLEKGADKKILTEFEESAFDLATENEALKENGTDLSFLKIPK